jgi:hypothetical protein
MASDLQHRHWKLGKARGTKAMWHFADELTGKESFQVGQHKITGESMSISSVSNASSAAVQPQPVSRRQQEDVAWRQLQQGLQTGDLAGVQQAYTTLAAFGQNNSGPFSNPTQAAEFKSLGQSIQEGDLSGAKQEAGQIAGQQLAKDLTRYEKDVQSGNPAGGQALANLKGDYWAVTGQDFQGSTTPNVAATTSDNPTGPAINVQA